MKKHLAVLLSVLFLANIGFSQADRYTKLWEKSQAGSNYPSFMGTGHTERGFAYGTVGANERIFLVSRLSGTNVVILNAANGDSVGTLNTTGVSGGTFTLNDADVSSDGKIFACNLTTASNTTAFKVYRWNDESTAPTAVINYTTPTGYRLGDKFTVVGSTSDNSITIWAAASASNKVFRFNTTDNGASFTATEITLSNGAQGSVPSVAPKGTGAVGFYMNSAGRNVVQFSAAGTAIDTLSGGIVATGSTYLTYMTQSSKEYLAVYNYGGGNENIRFVEVTGGLAAGALVFVTPSLGTMSNTNGTGDVGFKNNGDGTFNLYMLATNNGLAAYRTKVYANVTFNAIMRIKILKGDFNPATDSVVVRGTFNSWSGIADMLTDPDGDSTYSLQKKYLPADEAIEFKFVMRKGGADSWEGVSNRQLTPAPGDNTYTAYFDNDSIYVQRFPIAMTFSCNMELEKLSGRFDPATDTVSVNGSFQGWTPKANRLLPNPLNPDLYEGTWTINAGVGESIEFKFWYTDNNWESIPNRTYTFTNADIANGYASYSGNFNNGTLETVLNQPATLKFTVFVPPGAISAINGQPFPVVNTVHAAGSALPLQWPAGGWPDSDSTLMIKLYDDGSHGDATAGDKIFTNLITFLAYTVLRVEYKYGINFGDAANNGGGNDNEAGFAQNHILQMHRYLMSATVIDTFAIRPDYSYLKDVVLGPHSIWEPQSSGVTSTLRAVRGINNNIAWVTGYTGLVLKTTNGGTNWVTMTPPDATFDNYTMYALDGNVAWIFATGSSGLDARIFKTTNGGTSWTQQYQNANSFGNVIHFFDANNGVASGDPETGDINNWLVLTTTDGGTTWTRVPAANIPLADGANGEVGTSNSTWAVGDNVWFGSYGSSTLPAPKVYRSTDRGLHWTSAPITGFAAGSVPYLAFKDANNGIAVNTSGQCSKTTNGGATWSTPIVVHTGGFRSAFYVSGNTYIAAGGATATGNFYVTRDGGNTWTSIGLPAGTPRLRNVYFTSVSNGWIIGNNGIIKKWIGGDITNPLVNVEGEAEIPKVYTLYQNYPNPFNPTTTIKFSIPEPAKVILKIYNILGQEVATLVDNELLKASEYSYDFDASRLASGTYIYQLTAGNFRQAKKMLFLK